MNVLEIQHLVKEYTDADTPVRAIDGISLTVAAGEFTAIVGPSGSGKTSLLNMIGGLDTPTSGTIHVQQQNITQLTAAQRIDFRRNHIGFVFQSYNLIPVLTAIENVALILQLQGVSKKERQQRAVELLTAVGLQDRIHSRPANLSGGQQQRVAVARALASRPTFVLADEPTANLDSKATENLLQIMQQLNKEEGTTFIFSTHDQRVINKARRIITVEDGKIHTDEQVVPDSATTLAPMV